MLLVNQQKLRLQNGSGALFNSHLSFSTQYRDTGTVSKPSWLVQNNFFNNLTEYEIRVESLTFMNMVYPTNSSNNQLSVKVDGGSAQTLTVTEGVYTTTTLITELESLLTISPITTTVTYDDTTYKFTFAVSGGTLEFVDIANSMYDQLGLDVDEFAVISSSKVADFPIDLSGSSHVDVLSNLTCSDNVHSSNLGSLLCHVPLDVNYGDLVEYRPIHDTWMRVSGQQGFQEFTIQLRDDHGNDYTLPDNQILTITLIIRGVPYYIHDPPMQHNYQMNLY